jgi:hypothetical protein
MAVPEVWNQVNTLKITCNEELKRATVSSPQAIEKPCLFSGVFYDVREVNLSSGRSERIPFPGKHKVPTIGGDFVS